MKAPWPHECPNQEPGEVELEVTTEPRLLTGDEPQRWKCRACGAEGGKSIRMAEAGDE